MYCINTIVVFFRFKLFTIVNLILRLKGRRSIDYILNAFKEERRLLW
jgi:hypothetical protein